MMIRITAPADLAGTIESFASRDYAPEISEDTKDGFLEAIRRDDEEMLAASDGEAVTGLYRVIVLPEDRYIELKTGFSACEQAASELVSFLADSYPGYHADFVFPPSDLLMRRAVTKAGASLLPVQRKMVFTHAFPKVETPNVSVLPPVYREAYIDLHEKDMYWTGDRVIEAPDRFRTYVALEDRELAGYIDVTIKYDENEPYDLYVKPEFRRKGYGRQLLARALEENEPNGMILFVEDDNEPAMRLYESMGFRYDASGDLLTAQLDLRTGGKDGIE